MKFILPAIALVLAGCATSAPPPSNPTTGAGARIVPIGQPRRLSDGEARLSGAQASAVATRMADHERTLFQIEAALKVQVPDHAVTDILLTDAGPNGWRCGRVAFAGSDNALTRFAARTGATEAEVVLGRDDDALHRIRSLCDRS